MATSRREVLMMGAGAALWLSACADAEPASQPVSKPYPWFPKFPIASKLLVTPFAGDVEEGMVLETAAGLAGRAALKSKRRTLVYESNENRGYVRWFKGYCAKHRPIVSNMTLDEAVAHLSKSGVIKGYILYRFENSTRPLHSPGKVDESVNVATALAGLFGAVVVSERLRERFEKLGLKQLLDAREMSESECLAKYGDEFSTNGIGTSDPKARNARSLMVAMDLFVCSAQGKAYLNGLARCKPDSPVVGWGVEGEDKQTMPSSRYGLFQTATNWCHNLTVFAGEGFDGKTDAGSIKMKPPKHWSDLDWGDGKHFACYTMTDGDNVQWMMGNFIDGSEAPSYYGNPDRGKMPFGWGIPASSLARLSPRTLSDILSTATANDDFMIYNGGGYFYPDLYGTEEGHRDALRLQGVHLRPYMDATGIKILAFNFQDWDSGPALEACRKIAVNLPGLLGIFAFQYYPYSAGEGAIKWIKGANGDDVPIVSCSLAVWAQTGRPRDTTPASVAKWLNGMPVCSGEGTERNFSWVLVHAWSRFKDIQDPSAPLNAEEIGVDQYQNFPGTARGYEPALWSARRLGLSVKAVTPTELLLRVRMRLRSKQFLGQCLRDVISSSPTTQESKLNSVQHLLKTVDIDPSSGEKCLEVLKRSWRSNHRKR